MSEKSTQSARGADPNSRTASKSPQPGLSHAKHSLNAERSQFFKMYVEPLCGAQLDPLIDEPEGAEFFVKILMEELSRRPQLAELIEKKANSGRSPEAFLPLESSVRMIGLQNVRNLLVLEKISEVIVSKTLEKKADTGEFTTPIPQLLQYATKSLQTFGEDGPHSHVAFASGLIFDILVILSAQNPDAGAKKKILTFLDESFNQGLEIVRAALILGKKRKRLVLEKHIISLALLNQASHVIMSILQPSYLDLLAKVKKAELSPRLQKMVLERQFKNLRQQLALLAASPFHVFDPMSPALLYCDSPYLLTEKDEINYFDIAALAFLANELFSRPTKYKPTITYQARDLCPELLQFDLVFKVDHLFAKKGGGP